MSTRAKQNKKWHAELKKWWTDNAMPQVCEVCGANWPIALAHSKKRRYILTREDYFTVALLCQAHHEELEFSGHENMEKGILEIIARRI